MKNDCRSTMELLSFQHHQFPDSTIFKMTAIAFSDHQLPPTTTPSSYCPIPQSLIPNCSSLPVGLLACQRDPNLKSLESLLIKAQEVKDDPTSQKKQKEKGSKSEEISNSAFRYSLLLYDTPIFPEGGGQPNDTGTITLIGTSNNIKLRVDNAIRRNLDAIHFVTLPQDENQRREAQEWLENLDESNPKKVLVEVDWDRRLDHMQCHTGQHLISALFESLPNPIPTLSWGLTTFPSPLYIELPRLPSEEEADSVSKRMQQLISGEGIEGGIPSVRVEVSAEEENRPDSIPQDYKASEEEGDGRKGVVRTVVIEGVDRNPCCGTHLPSLSNLSPSFILPLSTSTKVRGTNFRLYFSFGSRTLSLLQSSFKSNLEISRALGCNESETSVRAQDVIKKEREGRKERTKMEESWAKEKALEILEKSLNLFSISQEQNQGGEWIRSSIDAYKRKQSILSGSILEIERIQSDQKQVLVMFHKSEATLEALLLLSKELNDLLTHLENETANPLPLLIIGASCGSVSNSSNAESDTGSLLIFTVGGGTHLVPKEVDEPETETEKSSKKPAKKQGKVKETEAQLHSAKLVNQISKCLSESELGKKVKGGGAKGRYQGKVLTGWVTGDENLRKECMKKGIEG